VSKTLRSGGKIFVFIDVTLFAQNHASPSRQFAASPSRRFEFQKRRQQFIRMHNVTLPIVAVRISNKDRSPFAIHGRDPAARPTGSLEIVSYPFPIAFHTRYYFCP
jgi:hypothetical protein